MGDSNASPKHFVHLTLVGTLPGGIGLCAFWNGKNWRSRFGANSQMLRTCAWYSRSSQDETIPADSCRQEGASTFQEDVLQITPQNI